MDLISIILISIVLAIDNFSICIAKGFSLKNITPIQSIQIGIFFGGFHVLMPILGYISGYQFKHLISTIAPWIAFIILSIIGLKMIYESLKNNNEEEVDKNKLSFKELTLLAIATSIDAFAIGITFAITGTSILIPLILIGITVFLFSQLGILIGKKIGHLFEDKLEIVGGLVLIGLGLRIFLGG